MNEILRRNASNAYIQAAVKGDLTEVRQLLEAGTPPAELGANYFSSNHDDPLNGKNALDAAISGALHKPEAERSAHLEVIKYLREKGLDIDAPGNPIHPNNRLAGAVYRASHPDAASSAKAKARVEFLLMLGADPFVKPKPDSMSAMDSAIVNAPEFALQFIQKFPEKLQPEHAIEASYRYRPEVLGAIMDKRPDLIHAVNKAGNGLIHNAVYDHIYHGNHEIMKATAARQLETVKLILARDPQSVHRVARGNSPLHLAANGSNRAVTEALLDAGAQVNEAGPNGNTAAHIAALHNTSAATNLRLLLDRGADLTVANGAGQTLRDLAVSVAGENNRDHPTALRILTERTAAGKVSAPTPLKDLAGAVQPTAGGVRVSPRGGAIAKG